MFTMEVSCLVHRPTVQKEGTYFNLYVIPLDMSMYSAPYDQNYFLDGSDIGYSANWYPQSWDSDSDQEHLH